ncbi:MAG: formylglycine-generating enzyme family protein [Myxococcales bacterium]|nr:formylglycine-generating enzyme family protein [Myxococcales bacterium]
MIDAEAILSSHGAEGDPSGFVVAADWFLDRGERHLAASALDRAYGLAPDDRHITAQRAALLDDLAIEEHGLVFRYVPAGTFRMGSSDGDPDERPVHPVRTAGFHLAQVPITWAAYCDLMGWEPPPSGAPTDEELERSAGFHLYERNKIRLQYCETDTKGARDWHAHAPDMTWQRGGEPVDNAELFGVPPGREPDRPWRYDRKPMVAVAFEEAEELAQRLSAGAVRYGLPSEAQWEKAARGGLVDAPFPWGWEPPTPDRCDCDHFGQFALRDPTSLAANGYGLHGMAGGVWEWTSDSYWAPAYHAAVHGQPARPAELPERALRGGSWADCAAMVRVSARMSRDGGSWRLGEWSGAQSPVFGFRLARFATDLS